MTPNDDAERLRELVRQRRAQQEKRRIREQVKLRNWSRGDRTISPTELFVTSKKPY